MYLDSARIDPLISIMSFSVQLQLSYLWLHRDQEVKPARTLLSPLASEGQLWFSVGGCVGFLAEEQKAQDFSSLVLLSAHSVLAKDHRKLLLRHQLQGGEDERVSNAPSYVCKYQCPCSSTAR